ncbi:unnamed protein product, partial [Arabidopsis halleri]
KSSNIQVLELLINNYAFHLPESLLILLPVLLRRLVQNTKITASTRHNYIDNFLDTQVYY